MTKLGTFYDAFFSDESPATSAGLVIKDRSVVSAEVRLVTTCHDVELLVCLVLAHSVLNESFSKLKTFMSYVQKFWLDIDGCSIPQQALKFHQGLASEVIVTSPVPESVLAGSDLYDVFLVLLISSDVVPKWSFVVLYVF